MNMRELTYRYLHDELTEDQFAQLQRWIESDIANAEAFVRFASDDVGIAKTLQHNEYGELIFDFASNNDDDSDAEADEELDLQQLIELENQASPIPFTQTAIADQGSRPGDKPITLKEFKSAASYLIAHSVKTKAAAIAAIAAVLVLSLTLFLVLRTTSPAPQAPPTVHQDTPATPDQPVVATLTAQQNAQWASASLAAGLQLRAGTRLTLTTGFAEITTARGAIAILEAPATIELTDNDNAIELHSGKLVGICETESSIGFLVRTPSAHIVDIGTSFGVQVSDDKVTTLQVYKGQVQIAPITQNARDGQPISVLAGQATQSDIAKGLSIVDFEPRRFAAFFPSDPYRPLLIGDNARWVDVLPVDLAEGSQVSEDAQIFIEQKGLVLDRDLAVNLVGRDRWPEQIDGPMRLLRAGDRVDIYLIHLDTPDDGKARQIRLTVDFGREILGVIAGTDDLASTDRLADPDARRTYPSAKPEVRRGLESQDSVVPGADGTSLELHLDIKQHIDQVRVLVRSHAPALRPHDIH